MTTRTDSDALADLRKETNSHASRSLWAVGEPAELIPAAAHGLMRAADALNGNDKDTAATAAYWLVRCESLARKMLAACDTARSDLARVASLHELDTEQVPVVTYETGGTGPFTLEAAAAERDARRTV